MTWVDWAALGIMAVSALVAFVRGLVREVLGLGAWIGAAGSAYIGMPTVRAIVGQWIEVPEYAEWASYLIVFIIALIILMLVAHAIGSLVRGSPLGGIDRTLGLLFGLGRGAVIIMIAYVLGGLADRSDQWPIAVQRARVLTPAYVMVKWATEQLPLARRPKIYEPPAAREVTPDDLARANPRGRATDKPPPKN